MSSEWAVAGGTGGSVGNDAVDGMASIAGGVVHGSAGVGVPSGPLRVAPHLWGWAELLRDRTALVLAPVGLRSATDPVLGELAGVIEALCTRFAGGDPVYVVIGDRSALHEMHGRGVTTECLLSSAATRRSCTPGCGETPSWYEEDVAAGSKRARVERSK